LKIIVASTFVPFIEGAETTVAADLVETLRKQKHRVDVVQFPLFYSASEMPEQLLAMRLFDISADCDLLIATGIRSCLLRHPNKVLWCLRSDFRKDDDCDILGTDQGFRLRITLANADRLAMQEARCLYASSAAIAGQLLTCSGFESRVLYPPLMNAEQYRCAEYGDYILCPNHVTPLDRPYLAVQAMRFVSSRLRLILTPPATDPEDIAKLRFQINEYGLQEKVELLDRRISFEEIIALFSNALGTVHFPIDEETSDLVILQSFQSRKPVITCTDSKLSSEFVEDRVNGFCVPPDAHAIAAAIEQLSRDRNLAQCLGHAGWKKLSLLNINWDRVAQELTG